MHLFPAIVCCATLALMRLIRFSTISCQEAGPFTDFTIQVIHTSSIADPRGDPIADIFEIRIANPRPLMQQVEGEVQIVPIVMQQAIAMLLLGGTSPEATTRTTANLMRRYQFSTAITAASVNAAAQSIANLQAVAERNQSGNGMRSGQPTIPSSWPSTILTLLLQCVSVKGCLHLLLLMGITAFMVDCIALATHAQASGRLW
jgi:hypothetical protein